MKLGAALRARQQERQVAAIQRSYEDRAKQSGIFPPQGGELAAAVGDRLASRPHPAWPKAKGELHLFLAYAVTNWEAVLPRALAPFGQVTVFDWREAGFNDLAADWVERRDEMNAAMLKAFEAANRDKPVDAVIGYLSGHNTAPETLAAMAAAGAARFNFCWDDKLYFPGRQVGGRYASPASIAQEIDLNLTNAPSSIVKYAIHGGIAMFWPEAAHPEIHRPHDTPFEFDVSFVGARYGWRPAFIQRLQRLLRPHGIQVECFGRGWPAGPLSDSEMIRLYSRSRINLGFAGIGHSKRLMCLKGRDFEVPMSGGLYLTQDNPELRLVFDVGREIFNYTDEVDCARQIRRLLADPELAQAARQAGRARCLSDHTYEARWTQVLTLAGILTA